MLISGKHLQCPGLLGLSDGMDEGSSGKGLNAAVSQAGGGRAVAEELESMIRDVTVNAQDGGNIDNLEVGTEIIEDDGGGSRRRGGIGMDVVVGGISRKRRRRVEEEEGALELSKVAGERERGGGVDGSGLERPGGEGGDEAGGFEGIAVVVVVIIIWLLLLGMLRL